jgi:hypothetical protein
MLVSGPDPCEHMFEPRRFRRWNGGVALDEQPQYVPIVREPDVRRLASAARAVLAEFDRLRELVGHRPEILARLYATSAVRADDDHGRAAGLVIQADEMRWSELEEMVRLAEAQLESGQHAGISTWHPDCADCRGVLAVARVRARHRFRTVGPGHPPPAPGGGPVSGSGPPAEGGTATPGRGPP